MANLEDVLTDEDKANFQGFADGIAMLEAAISGGLSTSTTLRVAAANLRAGADLFDDVAERMDADE